MSWLWLISVGVSDVQFPAWKQDEYGQWTGPFRFDAGRHGVRALHENLLALANGPGVVFPSETPDDRQYSRGLQLDIVREGDHFYAGIPGSDFLITRHGDTIPNAVEERLPLYFPKQAPLVGVAAELIGDAPVTVIVLNTRRNEDAVDGSREPVAAGPLVSKFLAGRLGLEWVNNGGATPNTPTAGTSTWVDILVGYEVIEDSAVERHIVERLTDVIQRADNGQDLNVLATASGGIPGLKPFLERVAATCVGQENVKLLDNPDRRVGHAEPELVALDYHARAAEQEALRFYCAQALRERDYVSAYGMARRYPDTHWAGRVRNLLGPLLELPGNPIQINGEPAHHLVVIACKVEIRMSMGDVAGALNHLGAFMESATLLLIDRDARILELGLTVNCEDEFLKGNLPEDHDLRQRNLVETPPYSKDRHYIRSLIRQWPQWLNQQAGEQPHAAQPLLTLINAYRARTRNNKKDSPRDCRNTLAHPDKPITSEFLNKSNDRLLAVGLVAGVNQPFGNNFLAVREVNRLLNELALSPAPIRQQLEDLLHAVIRP